MPWIDDPYEWIDPEQGRGPGRWVNSPASTTPRKMTRISQETLNRLTPAQTRLKNVLLPCLQAGMPREAALSIFNRYGVSKVSEMRDSSVDDCIRDISNWRP